MTNNRKLFILLAFIFLSFTSNVFSQELYFTITETLIYSEEELDTGLTRRMRDLELGKAIIIHFFPSDYIEVKVPPTILYYYEEEDSFQDLFDDGFLQMNNDANNSYAMTHEFERDKYFQKVSTDMEVRLSFDSFFNYIKGGTIEFIFNDTLFLDGNDVPSDSGHTRTVFEFERI